MNCHVCTVRPGFVQSLLVKSATTSNKEPPRLEYVRTGWNPCPGCAALAGEIAETEAMAPVTKPCMCLICVKKRQDAEMADARIGAQ